MRAFFVVGVVISVILPSDCYLFARTGSRAFSGLLTDMHRICFFEWVMTVRAGKVTFGSFVRADGHGGICQGCPLPGWLLRPAKRCPFYLNLFSLKRFFEPFEDTESAVRGTQRAGQMCVRIDHHLVHFQLGEPGYNIFLRILNDDGGFFSSSFSTQQKSTTHSVIVSSILDTGSAIFVFCVA